MKDTSQFSISIHPLVSHNDVKWDDKHHNSHYLLKILELPQTYPKNNCQHYSAIYSKFEAYTLTE